MMWDFKSRVLVLKPYAGSQSPAIFCLQEAGCDPSPLISSGILNGFQIFSTVVPPFWWMKSSVVVPSCKKSPFLVADTGDIPPFFVAQNLPPSNPIHRAIFAQDGSPEIFALGTLLPDLLERAAERCACLATEVARRSYCNLVLAPGEGCWVGLNDDLMNFMIIYSMMI